MGLADRLKERVKTAVKRVVTLPVISEKVLEDPITERRLALAGVVPQRCGLCRNFQPTDLNDTLRMNPAFAQAASLLSPSVMGHLKGAPPKTVGSEAARALRPHLSNNWNDYGGCAINPGCGVWAFAEQPPLNGSPCKVWR